MSWVWKSSKAKGIDRLVLLAIADWTWDDGTNAYPSVATMAKKTGVTTRTVQRSVRELVNIGELEVQENAGKHGSNMYRIVMQTPDSQSPRTADTMTDSRPVTQAQTPVRKSRNPRTADTRTVSEPFITKRARETAARQEEARRRKAECKTCHGDGWITDQNGKPIRQCRHQAKAS